MTATQEKPNRPKHKQLRMRKKENPLFLEWIDNQTDFNDSIRKLIESHVMRHGTKDMSDSGVILSMAKDLVLLDSNGQVVPVPVQKIEEVPPIQQEITKVEEKIEQEPEEKTEKNEELGKTIEDRNLDLDEDY
ncbi:hypothetical protein BC2926_38860 [Bacillus cereus]|nr:hypothetical protein BC2926_38860 [Bacillus cereus]